MSRRVDFLIEDIRKHTLNEDVSDSVGIQDVEFLRFLNDAQYRLHSLIVQQHPDVFLQEIEIDVVANQQEYSLPAHVHMGSMVSKVEYSDTGRDEDYYVVEKQSLRRRNNRVIASPLFYSRRNNKILVNPTPQVTRGKLRVTFVQSIPKLDKRRGSVDSVVLDNNVKEITSLMLDVSTDAVDSDALNKYTRFSVVDREGNVKMRNIKFDLINGSTGEVTVSSDFNFYNGETIESGDYIVAGPNSSTHSQFTDNEERYLIAYCAAKIFHRDSNADIGVQMQELTTMEGEIVASYADISDDTTMIPDINLDDDWGM